MKHLKSRTLQTISWYGCRLCSSDSVRRVMRCLPQPVVVVTSSMAHPEYGVIKRGVTCSSFTSVSLNPPCVSVSIYTANIVNSLIEKSNVFAANIMADNQVQLGMHFAKSLNFGFEYNQFEHIDHTTGVEGLPILNNALGVMQCLVKKVDDIGDHKVWYGEVMEASTTPKITAEPLLYYQRKFRSIGDEIFMQAFESTKMPFEEWTHEAHVRMAWNYIVEYGPDKATPMIKQGIKNFNESNKESVKSGYSETVTMFYIKAVSNCIHLMPPQHTFEEFLESNQQILQKDYLWKFYSPSTINSSHSKLNFVKPDRQPLP